MNSAPIAIDQSLNADPAGTYPTGHDGVERRFDGQVWSGPAIPSDDAPELHSPRSLGAMLRRSPVWVAVGGVLSGIALSLLGAAGEGSRALLLLSGVLATGGPILALILGVKRRLGLSGDALRRPTLIGVAAGIAAIGVALLLEDALGKAFDAQEGTPNTALLALAGPIEEGAKLLVPVALLVAGLAFISQPRAGVWVVMLSASVFGVTEGALYAAGLGGARAVDPVSRLTESFPGVTEAAAKEYAEVLTLVPRIWTELGHPLWATGAAVIIWIAAWERREHALAICVGAYAIAAGLHSFNDAVLTRLPGASAAVASLAFMALVYVFWFRRQVRRLVPPSSLVQVPDKWLPPLP